MHIYHCCSDISTPLTPTLHPYFWNYTPTIHSIVVVCIVWENVSSHHIAIVGFTNASFHLPGKAT